MDVEKKTVTGMAKYIDREALVEWLKRIPIKDYPMVADFVE